MMTLDEKKQVADGPDAHMRCLVRLKYDTPADRAVFEILGEGEHVNKAGCVSFAWYVAVLRWNKGNGPGKDREIISRALADCEYKVSGLIEPDGPKRTLVEVFPIIPVVRK